VTSSEEDRHLVARLVRSRDERAFAALYTRHTTYLYRLALRLTAGDEALSQDLVHDAWVRAVERLPAFEWKSRLATWLAGFVVNAWREAVRMGSRDVELDESYSADEEPWREPIDRVDVERALTLLPPGYRSVLVLHDIEGYTHEDIAGLLGVEAGTSKSQLSRARAAMRRALEGASPRRSNA
jgi:RNA polymerase sigma-70 factor (ECF subfamily)